MKHTTDTSEVWGLGPSPEQPHQQAQNIKWVAAPQASRAERGRAPAAPSAS